MKTACLAYWQLFLESVNVELLEINQDENKLGVAIFVPEPFLFAAFRKFD